MNYRRQRFQTHSGMQTKLDRHANYCNIFFTYSVCSHLPTSKWQIRVIHQNLSGPRILYTHKSVNLALNKEFHINHTCYLIFISPMPLEYGWIPWGISSQNAIAHNLLTDYDKCRSFDWGPRLRQLSSSPVRHWFHLLLKHK